MEEGSGVHVNLGAQVTLSWIVSNHFGPFFSYGGSTPAHQRKNWRRRLHCGEGGAQLRRRWTRMTLLPGRLPMLLQTRQTFQNQTLLPGEVSPFTPMKVSQLFLHLPKESQKRLLWCSLDRTPTTGGSKSGAARSGFTQLVIQRRACLTSRWTLAMDCGKTTQPTKLSFLHSVHPCQRLIVPKPWKDGRCQAR